MYLATPRLYTQVVDGTLFSVHSTHSLTIPNCVRSPPNAFVGRDNGHKALCPLSVDLLAGRVQLRHREVGVAVVKADRRVVGAQVHLV